MFRNMKTKNVQTVLKMEEYERFREALRLEKLPLKEGVRQAILSWTRIRVGFNKKDPFFTTRDMIQGKEDLSEKHDEIYMTRE